MLIFLRVLSIAGLLVFGFVALIAGALSESSFFGVEPTTSDESAGIIFKALALLSVAMIFIIIKYRNSGKVMFGSIAGFSLAALVALPAAIGLSSRNAYESIGLPYTPGRFYSNVRGYMVFAVIVVSLLAILFMFSFRVSRTKK